MRKTMETLGYPWVLSSEGVRQSWLHITVYCEGTARWAAPYFTLPVRPSRDGSICVPSLILLKDLQLPVDYDSVHTLIVQRL